MPTTHNLRARTETHCEPCEFHKLTAAFHVRSGEGSWMRYGCLHPEAYQFGPMPTGISPDRLELLLQTDELLKREGRDIGKTELQPQWCPLKRKE